MDKKLREGLEHYQREYPASARVERYLKDARARLDTASPDEAEIIRWLVIYARQAQQAISDGDIDLFAQAFERVIRRAVILNLPEHDKATESINQSMRGAGKAGKFGYFRTMVQNICDEIDSTEDEKVLGYWQKYRYGEYPVFSETERTAWGRYELAVSFRPGKESKYVYHYYHREDETEKKTNPKHIKVVLDRIRDSRNKTK